MTLHNIIFFYFNLEILVFQRHINIIISLITQTEVIKNIFLLNRDVGFYLKIKLNHLGLCHINYHC